MTARPDVENALQGAKMARGSSNPFVATQAGTIEELSLYAHKLEGVLDIVRAALKNVKPEATKLADEAKGMDWGDVSSYGCDVYHGINEAIGVIDRALKETG